LDARKIDFTDMTDEESLLFYIEDTFTGDDPNIKVVVYPEQKSIEPEEEKKRVLEESDETHLFTSHEVREKDGKEKETTKRNDKQYEENEKMSSQVEPVAVHNVQYLFVFSLARKGHHKINAVLVVRSSSNGRLKNKIALVKRRRAATPPKIRDPIRPLCLLSE
jgi:hypothetical protein